MLDDLISRRIALEEINDGFARAEARRDHSQRRDVRLRQLSGIERLAREILDIVDQPVGRGGGGLGLLLRHRVGDRGVQLGGQRQIGDFLIVLVPEPARQRVHQPHRSPREFVAGGGRDQDVEALVEPHEGDIVGLGGGGRAWLRNFGEFARVPPAWRVRRQGSPSAAPVRAALRAAAIAAAN